MMRWHCEMKEPLPEGENVGAEGESEDSFDEDEAGCAWCQRMMPRYDLVVKARVMCSLSGWHKDWSWVMSHGLRLYVQTTSGPTDIKKLVAFERGWMEGQPQKATLWSTWLNLMIYMLKDMPLAWFNLMIHMLFAWFNLMIYIPPNPAKNSFLAFSPKIWFNLMIYIHFLV